MKVNDQIYTCGFNFIGVCLYLKIWEDAQMSSWIFMSQTPCILSWWSVVSHQLSMVMVGLCGCLVQISVFHVPSVMLGHTWNKHGIQWWTRFSWKGVAIFHGEQYVWIAEVWNKPWPHKHHVALVFVWLANGTPRAKCSFTFAECTAPPDQKFNVCSSFLEEQGVPKIADGWPSSGESGWWKALVRVAHRRSKLGVGKATVQKAQFCLKHIDRQWLVHCLCLCFCFVCVGLGCLLVLCCVVFLMFVFFVLLVCLLFYVCLFVCLFVCLLACLLGLPCFALFCLFVFLCFALLLFHFVLFCLYVFAQFILLFLMFGNIPSQTTNFTASTKYDSQLPTIPRRTKVIKESRLLEVDGDREKLNFCLTWLRSKSIERLQGPQCLHRGTFGRCLIC